jgi:peptidoglycan/LPS O-acetylase OafA/YrhL
MVGAVLTLTAVLLSPAMRRGLSHPWLVALGRISFSIYAIHGVMLTTLVCWAFNELHPGAATGGIFFQPDGPSYTLHILVVLLLYLATTVAAAIWLTAAVDEPCVRLSHRLGRWIIRHSPPAPALPEASEGSKVTTLAVATPP